MVILLEQRLRSRFHTILTSHIEDDIGIVPVAFTNAH